MSGAAILKNYLYQLYKTLLQAHIKSASLKPTIEEEISVKSFCVLAHAAVEEFIEGLCKDTLHTAYMKYKSKLIVTNLPQDAAELNKVNLGIIQLIETLILASNFSIYSSQQSDALKGYKSKLERVTEIYNTGSLPTLNDLAELTKKTDSYTKEILKDTKKFFEDHIETNHGASLKYLLRLLIPVGIDIPNTIELNSLQKLAEYRGSYAHGKGVSQILSATDVTKYAADVITLCKLIERSIDDFEKI
jgi:RiboL-PSP-HEPN